LVAFLSDRKEKYSCIVSETTTLYPGGIRSHDPWLQSRRWQAWMLPLDHAARAIMYSYYGNRSWDTLHTYTQSLRTSWSPFFVQYFPRKNVRKIVSEQF
jgi:hypothetical protein